MESAQLTAALGGAIFVLVQAVVGFRLLLLWHRTRQLPELAIGGGFVMIGVIGYPLMSIAGVGSGTVAEVNVPLLTAGVAVVMLGGVVLNLFTWKVFRPRSSGAAMLVSGCFVAACTITWGSARSLSGAPPDADPVSVAASWWLSMRGMMMVWYVWTGYESLREYAMARRRLSLGLSDPVVANRFLLWGVMGAVLAVINAISVAMQTRGLSPAVDAAPALLLLLNGATAGVLMILTFMPPAAYLRGVRRRAEATGS